MTNCWALRINISCRLIPLRKNCFTQDFCITRPNLSKAPFGWHRTKSGPLLRSADASNIELCNGNAYHWLAMRWVPLFSYLASECMILHHRGTSRIFVYIYMECTTIRNSHQQQLASQYFSSLHIFSIHHWISPLLRSARYTLNSTLPHHIQNEALQYRHCHCLLLGHNHSSYCHRLRQVLRWPKLERCLHNFPCKQNHWLWFVKPSFAGNYYVRSRTYSMESLVNLTGANAFWNDKISSIRVNAPFFCQFYV